MLVNNFFKVSLFVSLPSRMCLAAHSISSSLNSDNLSAKVEDLKVDLQFIIHFVNDS